MELFHTPRNLLKFEVLAGKWNYFGERVFEELKQTMSIYCRLKAVFEERKINEAVFAESVGISLAALNELVDSRSLPTMEIAEKIAKELLMKVAEIWILDEE